LPERSAAAQAGSPRREQAVDVGDRSGLRPRRQPDL